MSTNEYIVVGIAVLACGAVLWTGIFLVILWFARRRTRQAARLRTAPGVLHAIAPKFVQLSGRAASASYWTLAVRYDYVVDGVPHRGDRFALEFHSWFRDEAAASAAAARFRVGDEVTVWYDPLDPGTAVLDPTPPAGQTYYRNFAIGSAVGAVVLAGLAVAAARLLSPAGW